jgi:segregation and condensation protein B
MAKKSKSAPKAEPAPESDAPASAPKANRRKKKGADAPLLNGDAPEPEVVETPVETPAVEEPAPPEVVEAPRKRGKKKKSDEVAAEVPVEAESGDTTTSLPAVDSNGAEEIPTEAASSDVPPDTAEPPPAAIIDWDALARTVEALLFAAEEPLQARELGRCSGSDSATIRKLIPKIRERYDAERRPWDILETGTGWRMVTRPEFYPAIQRLKTQTLQRKLTQAGLETLALIAYRQPISRAEVENVRGVGAGAVLRQLLERKLIKISGRGTGLGQPLLYGTTDYFLEHFGLKSLQDLPKPNEFKQ